MISQVWDLLEAPDDQLTPQHSARLQRSWSHQSDDDADAAASGLRRLSLKKLFKSRTLRRLTRPSDAPTVTSPWQAEAGGDELLTERVVATIPSTEIDLANYIVAHGILSKELR